MLIRILILLIFISASCTRNNSPIVGLQPFEKIESSIIDSVVLVIEEVYGYRTIVLETRELPDLAFVRFKTPRYRADSLLNYLIAIKPDTVDYILGLTNKDISMTKRDQKGGIKKPEEKYTDWGVFGLAYRPGESCIVSTYRLRSSCYNTFVSRLKKVCLHELGHNLGLKHCVNDSCVMQDAAESIKTIDRVQLKLCEKCSSKIK
ncbi:MAG: hypothetical protein JXB00_08115 [Bacteroidales bacterium]|nr:hypothetical protein [Bacteroidales bacterium]